MPYKNVEDRRAAEKRYQHSAKGRATQARYKKSAKGRRVAAKHWKTYVDDPVKKRARWLVQSRIRRGTMKRMPCEVCGKKAHAHHTDYSKPAEVKWLCPVHHGVEHRVAA